MNFITSIIQRNYQNLVIGTPWLCIVLLVLLAAYFLSHTHKFNLDASADSLLLENDQSLKIFRETNERYGSQDFLFITFTPDDKNLFSDSSLATINNLKNDLLKLESTSSVLSLVDVPLLTIAGGTLAEVAENYQTVLDPGVDRELAKQELLNSPIFRKLVISEDAGTTALQINIENETEYLDLQKKKNRLLIQKLSTGLNENELAELEQVKLKYKQVKERVDQAKHQYIIDIRSIMDDHRAQGTLHLGGISMIADDMVTFIKRDLMIFGLGIFAFLVLLLSIIFRQWRWVMLPLMSCVYAGLVMIGCLGLIGWDVTVISSNFISLMLILTMSMNVHLIVRYRELCAEQPAASQQDLVLETTKKMVWPCLYTALTTMIGFSSLVFSDIKPVIDFGWMMTMGLSVSFITTFLLFPSLLVLLPRSERDQQRSANVRFTSALSGFTAKHGTMILVAAVIFVFLSVVGIKQLRVENSFVNYFSKDTEIYQGLKLIDDKLGGTTPLDVTIRFNEPVFEEFEDDTEDDSFEDFDDLFGDEEADPADTFFTSTNLETVTEAHEFLQQIPAVGKVLSLDSVLTVAQDLNRGKPFDAFELAVINRLMPEELRSSLLSPYISIDNNETRISLRIKDSMPDLRRKQLLEQIEQGLQTEVGLAPDQYQLSGLLVLYNNMLQSLFSSQIKTLGVVMLGIFLMLLLLFRSIKLALVGIIPNILAACSILGIMGLVNLPLDMMTITIAAITIGIAVDDCIHYIYRFREEFPRRQQYEETMHYCHANIGRAMFYTSVTIIFGFSILVLSNFIPTIYFGILTTLGMLLALLAALTLLPKLILMWKPF